MGLKYRVPDKQRLQWAEKDRRGDGRPPAEDDRGGLRPRADHPARAEIDRDRRAGAPDRRHRHRHDAERDLRADRTEDEAAEPAAADDGDRAGQRRRRLHPAARAASPGRLQHLAGALGRPGGPRRAEDRRGGARAAGEGRRQAAPRVSSRAAAPPRTQSCEPSRRRTGGWTSSPARGPSIRPAAAATPSTSRAWCSSWRAALRCVLPGRRDEPRRPLRRGPLEARLAGLGDRYSVSLWFWNGMPNEGRETAGWMFSRGRDTG